MTDHLDRTQKEALFLHTLREAGFDELAERVRRDEPLAPRTTMRVGGPADLFVEPLGLYEVTALVRAANKAGIPYFVMGNGSNIVFSDAGVEGLVIAFGRGFSKTWREIDPENENATLVSVFAGAILAKTAFELSREGFDGLWFAAGIPGSVGGAVFMNAGAYGGQMSDVVCRTTFLTPDGECKTVTGDEHEFDYRDSVFTRNGGLILSTTLRLLPGDRVEILDKIATLNAKRAASQPLQQPSAGSVFKRPPGYFAGTLIEQTGCKGLSIGGACVSQKHAGFIVNTGGATACDIAALVEKVSACVLDRTGVLLEPEIRFVGRGFGPKGD